MSFSFHCCTKYPKMNQIKQGKPERHSLYLYLKTRIYVSFLVENERVVRLSLLSWYDVRTTTSHSEAIKSSELVSVLCFRDFYNFLFVNLSGSFEYNTSTPPPLSPTVFPKRINVTWVIRRQVIRRKSWIKWILNLIDYFNKTWHHVKS